MALAESTLRDIIKTKGLSSFRDIEVTEYLSNTDLQEGYIFAVYMMPHPIVVVISERMKQTDERLDLRYAYAWESNGKIKINSSIIALRLLPEFHRTHPDHWHSQSAIFQSRNWYLVSGHTYKFINWVQTYPFGGDK